MTPYSISMRDAMNARKKTEAYLNKTAAFLISCLWNFGAKSEGLSNNSVYEYRIR